MNRSPTDNTARFSSLVPAPIHPMQARLLALADAPARAWEPRTIRLRLMAIPAVIARHARPPQGDTRQTATPNRHNQPHDTGNDATQTHTQPDDEKSRLRLVCRRGHPITASRTVPVARKVF